MAEFLLCVYYQGKQRKRIRRKKKCKVKEIFYLFSVQKKFSLPYLPGPGELICLRYNERKYQLRVWNIEHSPQDGLVEVICAASDSQIIFVLYNTNDGWELDKVMDEDDQKEFKNALELSR